MLQHLRQHRFVHAIWEELGLQEMSKDVDVRDGDSSRDSPYAGWHSPTVPQMNMQVRMVTRLKLGHQ